MPMMRGGTPAEAMPRTRARGVRPWRFTASSDAMIMAAAPSLTPDALPAVTVPGLRNARAQLRELLERGLGPRMLVVVDDDRARPCRRAPRRRRSPRRSSPPPWPCRRAAASAARRRPGPARDTWYSSATFSPVSRHRVDAVLRLHQRIDEAPADGGVVDLGRALERFRRLAHHERRAGHRFDAAGDARGRSRRRGSRAPPRPTALRPEAHSRLTVMPGTLSGRPASSSAMRATLRLSSPAWLAQPK